MYASVYLRMSCVRTSNCLRLLLLVFAERGTVDVCMVMKRWEETDRRWWGGSGKQNKTKVMYTCSLHDNHAWVACPDSEWVREGARCFSFLSLTQFVSLSRSLLGAARMHKWASFLCFVVLLCTAHTTTMRK